jgi:hypothetical protein
MTAAVAGAQSTVVDPVDPTYAPLAYIAQGGADPLCAMPDGKVVYHGGREVFPLGRAQQGIFRLNADGSLDETFFVGPMVTVNHAVPTPEGGLYLLGSIRGGEDGDVFGLVRLTANGAVDPDFARIDVSTDRFWVLPDGRLLVPKITLDEAQLTFYSAQGEREGAYTFVSSEVTDTNTGSEQTTTLRVRSAFVTGSGKIGLVRHRIILRNYSYNMRYESQAFLALLDEAGEIESEVRLGGTRYDRYFPSNLPAPEFGTAEEDGIYLVWQQPVDSYLYYDTRPSFAHLSDAGALTPLEHGYELFRSHYSGQRGQISLQMVPVSPVGVVLVGPVLGENPRHIGESMEAWRSDRHGISFPRFAWRVGRYDVEAARRAESNPMFAVKIIDYDHTHVIAGFQRLSKVADSGLPVEVVATTEIRHGDTWVSEIMHDKPLVDAWASGREVDAISINGARVVVTTLNPQSVTTGAAAIYRLYDTDGTMTRVEEKVSLLDSEPWFKTGAQGSTIRWAEGVAVGLRLTQPGQIGGTAPYYQWYRDGVAISAPSPTHFLQLGPADSTMEGDYQYRVFNAFGELWSPVYTFEVVAPPDELQTVYQGHVVADGVKVGDAAVYLTGIGEAVITFSVPDEGLHVVQTVSLDHVYGFEVTLPGLAPAMGATMFNEAPSTLTLSGGFDGNGLQAQFSANGFSGELTAVAVGRNGDTANYFVGELLGTHSGQVHLFVSPDDQVQLMVTQDGETLGGVGTLSDDEEVTFTVNLPAGQVALGQRDLPTGHMSGEIRAGEDAAARAHFMGLRHGTLRTDRLANLSRRGEVTAPDEVLIAGFVLGAGSGDRDLLVRGVGPALAHHGVAAPVADPVLVLYDRGIQIAYNDDWGSIPYPENTAEAASRVGAFAYPKDSLDSAVVAQLAPGPYTVHLSSNKGPGTVLFEVYDATTDPLAGAVRLSNLSTRGLVQAETRLLICGFVIAGNHPRRVLIRAAGSTLAEFGVENPLSDPVLSVYEGNRLVTRNDDWGDYGEERIAPAVELVGAFPFVSGSNESAVLLTLPPGVYTAHVNGVGEEAGESLVEVYALPLAP